MERQQDRVRSRDAVDFTQPSWEPDRFPGRHRSDGSARYLVVSTTNRPEVVEYPDIGAALVVLTEQRRVYPLGANTDQ